MRKIMLLFVALFAFVLVGCIPTTTEATITVENSSVEVEVGDLVSISPIVNGVNSGLYYTSSDESVFTVSNGVISGVGVGNANLTIGLLNTQVTAIVNVTVIDPVNDDNITPPDDDDDDPIVDNDTYSIANGNLSIEVEEEVVLQVLKGSNVYTGAINWLSNNNSVVVVDANGVVTGVSAGNAKIVAIISGVPVTIDVVVRNKTVVTVLPTSLTVNGSNFVNIDDSVVLTATPDQGVITGLVWASSDETKATVNDFGIVTGISSGIVTITAVLADNLEVFGTFTLLVKEADTSASPITSISITGASEVLAGNRIKLMVSYTPSTEPATFTYASSNEAVATVDSAGWVTGVAGGAVQITATLVGDTTKNASFSVTVIPLPE
ncbi:MAG: Ig-like domain-containing protein, partial [Bacilli bacterium]|nr:Ig-like domain-containing protein [Bacilli bacterium]